MRCCAEWVLWNPHALIVTLPLAGPKAGPKSLPMKVRRTIGWLVLVLGLAWMLGVAGWMVYLANDAGDHWIIPQRASNMIYGLVGFIMALPGLVVFLVGRHIKG